MRHLISGRKLSRRKEHRKAMLANLAASLIKNGRVKTTDAKAKEVRPFVERMVTFAKRGDLHARRIVLSRLRDFDAVKKLFDEIGPRYTNRFGGYTRILKLGFRQGDNSPVSLIEFVEEEVAKKSAKKTKAKKKKTPKKPVKEPEKEIETIESEKTAEVVESEEATAEEVPAEASPDETEEVMPEKAEKTAGEEEKKSPPSEENTAEPSGKDAEVQSGGEGKQDKSE